MALELTSMLAQTFETSASMAVQVIDSTSVSPGREVSLAAAYYRIFLAALAWTGASKAQPKELLRALQAALNAAPGATHWTVTLTVDGLVRITWVGGTGAASIAWTSTALRHLLGFPAGTLSFGAPGASNTAAYQPLFCVFSHNLRKNSSGPVPVPRASAVGQTRSSQYAWTASTAGRKIVADIGTHPVDQAAKDAMNAASSGSAPGTVCWPSDTSRWITPVEAPADTLAPPWSLIDFFNTVHGWRVGAAFGNFRALANGSTNDFDDVRIDKETLQAEDAVAPTVAHFDQLVDWRRVHYRHLARQSRA